MVKGRKDLLSGDDLLQAVKKGKIVNGVCFEVGHYGDLAITHTGLDRNRRKIPVLVQNKKEKRYIYIIYEFVDILSDEMISISTAVEMELYHKLAFIERRVTGGLQHPKEYIEPMTLSPKS
jgi:hypothetical protein